MTPAANSAEGYRVHAIAQPEMSEWVCDLFDSNHAGAWGIRYQPLKGREPNAFHRLMQRLVLGFRWTKRGEG